MFILKHQPLKVHSSSWLTPHRVNHAKTALARFRARGLILLAFCQCGRKTKFVDDPKVGCYKVWFAVYMYGMPTLTKGVKQHEITRDKKENQKKCPTGPPQSGRLPKVPAHHRPLLEHRMKPVPQKCPEAKRTHQLFFG